MNNVNARFGAAFWWALPLAALVALLGWETDWGNAVESVPQPAAATAPEPVVASLLPDYAIAGGVAARTETVQRTLFNPTRRPAPQLAQDGGPGRLQGGGSSRGRARRCPKARTPPSCAKWLATSRGASRQGRRSTECSSPRSRRTG